jgi:hypothetical protein
VKTERGAVTDAPPKKISRHQATDQPQHNAADLSPETTSASALSRPPAEILEGGAALFDDVCSYIGRFVICPSEYALYAVVLWAVHSHTIDAAESSPRLAALSPEPASGKTRLLEVLGHLVPHPMHAINATPAALFRSVKDLENRPTILYDEIDTVFGPKAKENEEIRGLLNAGHRRGAVAYRCVGEGTKQKVEAFPAYAAVALAGLGDLPDTIMTRSIVIRMRRRAPTERVEAYRERIHGPQGDKLRVRLAEWAAVASEQLNGAWPTLPKGITDRPADVWEPLLAVAEAAGGDWPKRAEQACIAMVKASQDTDSGSLGIRLLADLRLVFGPHQKMATETILERLHALPEAPWGDLRGKPLDSRGLATRLKWHTIASTKVKIGEASVRGYRREDLHDAWQRYLPSSAVKTEPTEPPEPARSDSPDQVPGENPVPEPLREAEPDDPPPTSDVPRVPQVPLLTDRVSGCDVCGSTPSLIDRHGRRLCGSCAPHLFFAPDRDGLGVAFPPPAVTPPVRAIYPMVSQGTGAGHGE